MDRPLKAMREPKLHFDENYHEEAVLHDGTPVELRLVRPGDKELLKRGLKGLSAESRYRRFMMSIPSLSQRDLRYLTEIDGDRHFALGAALVDPLGREEGLGIARFVRQLDRPELAEPAVAVVDSYQHRGLGRLLCSRLAEAAVERGITHFRCEVLVSNEPMRSLLQELAPDAVVQIDGDTATIEFPLSGGLPKSAPDSAHTGILEHLLKLAARGLLVLRQAVTWVGISAE